MVFWSIISCGNIIASGTALTSSNYNAITNPPSLVSLNNLSTFVSTLNVSGNTTLNNATTISSSLNVVGNIIFRNYNYLQNCFLYFLHFHENFLHYHENFLPFQSRLFSRIMQHSPLRNHISERNKQRNARSLCPDKRPWVKASR